MYFFHLSNFRNYDFSSLTEEVTHILSILKQDGFNIDETHSLDSTGNENLDENCAPAAPARYRALNAPRLHALLLFNYVIAFRQREEHRIEVCVFFIL